MQHIFRAMGRCRKNCFEKWQKVCSGRIIILQQITMYLSCSPVFLSDSKLNCSFLQLAYTSAACLFKTSKCCFTMGRQFLAATLDVAVVMSFFLLSDAFIGLKYQCNISVLPLVHIDLTIPVTKQFTCCTHSLRESFPLSMLEIMQRFRICKVMQICHQYCEHSVRIQAFVQQAYSEVEFSPQEMLYNFYKDLFICH